MGSIYTEFQNPYPLCVCKETGAYSGEGFGGQNTLRKNPKTPLNFPVHTKKFKTPPSKNFWMRPCKESLYDEKLTSSLAKFQIHNETTFRSPH